MNPTSSIPLCVDLDGTLVKVDTLHQAFFLLLRRQPTSIFFLLGWLAKGKAYLKEQILKRVELDPTTLPYNHSVLDFLAAEKKAGRTLVLATAANHRTAQAVADHLGFFDEVFSSTETTNLRGKEKRNLLQKKYATFDYIGNDSADFPLWDAAQKILLANPSYAAKKSYAKTAEHLFEDRPPRWRSILKAIRPQQWLKNGLIITPLLLAHQFLEIQLFGTFLAFIAFSFAASSIYILNDLFDLSADQHHAHKRFRPFAAGNLPVGLGLGISAIFILLSATLSTFLPLQFGAVLLLYYILTTLYSWRLKQLEIIDVLTLAVLYALRIVAGGTATRIPVSAWFIIFSIFLFLSLALVKRVAELRETEEEHIGARERGYTPADLPLLMTFGATSGYLATLVFTMYLNSEKVRQLYSHPQLLWLFCPLLLYWITRIWLLTWRGQMNDDPLAFAARDLATYFVGGIGVILILLAT